MSVIQKYQQWQRQMVWVGWPICISGLVAGSFANTLETLILTQVVAYGVGFLILYYPMLVMVNEYWITRRGMAYELLCGASGVSGTVMPFVVYALLSKTSDPVPLRSIASLRARQYAEDKLVLFKNPLFWLYSISRLFQGFRYFFPSFYLPSFATSLDLIERFGPVLLAVTSASQVTGQFAFGYLSDRKILLNVLASTSTLVAAVTTVTMWRLAESFPVPIGYAILYGFLADATAGPVVFGPLKFGKGVGNVLTGLIGDLLVHNNSALHHLSAAESLIP
ncbi:hypothetical protein FVER53590_13566 [Fusarium verticillioides]|nr:hypothetical protein FVER53590_13566 [Fusarium verticillioides]